MTTRITTPAIAVDTQYRGLYKYLRDRFADTVVLTFDQIEDLLGFALPDVACRQSEWWADADATGGRSAQAQSWTQAGRTATPSVRARTVAFDRAC
jgi:hypothetical protein